MLPENRVPTHPGVILNEEYLRPLGITQVALAEYLGMPVQRINEIVRELHAEGTLLDLSLQFHGKDYTTAAAEFDLDSIQQQVP